MDESVKEKLHRGTTRAHPVYMRINTVISLNGEKRPGHAGEEESCMRLDKALWVRGGEDACEYKV